MKTYSYLAYLLLFLALGCQKPEALVVEPLPTPEEEIGIRNARVDQVTQKTEGLVYIDYAARNFRDVYQMPSYCTEYFYDSQNRISALKFGERTEPYANYNYQNGYALHGNPSDSGPKDTVRLDSRGSILSVNTVRLHYLYRSRTARYDANGYLAEENYTFYETFRESDATVKLRHSYLDGNRIKTVMVRPFRYNPGSEPDSAVIVYDYDKTRYNPNLPHDDYPLLGDANIGGSYFSDYGKLHFSLYGKLNRNLLKTATCSIYSSKQPYKHGPELIYNYRYTFDGKKRVDSTIVAAKSQQQAGIHLRKFGYKE